MTVAGPWANRSTQLNGLFSSLKLTTPFLIWSRRTLSPSRYRYIDVSSSQAWAQPPGHQVEVGHVRAVAVEEHDLLEAVVGERLGDVEHVVHEVLEVVVDRSGEVHDVAGVAVADGRQHQHLVGGLPAG